jgi:hypothetical protein
MFVCDPESDRDRCLAKGRRDQKHRYRERDKPPALHILCDASAAMVGFTGSKPAF